MSEQNNQKEEGIVITSKKGIGALTLIALACVAILMMVVKGSGYDSKGCYVITSSPFGTGNSQAWSTLPNQTQMQYLASFNFEVPENPLGLEDARYRAYSEQVAEVYYLDEEEVVKLLMSKAYTCDGSPMYEVTKDFNFVSTRTIGGHEVKCYGDSDTTCSVAEWADGAYAFAVLAIAYPLEISQLDEIIPYMN